MNKKRKKAKKKIIEEGTPSVLHLDVLRTYKHSGAQPETENAYYRKIDNKEFTFVVWEN